MLSKSVIKRIVFQRGACPKHPVYRAFSEPNIECERCWDIWKFKQRLVNEADEEATREEGGVVIGSVTD